MHYYQFSIGDYRRDTDHLSLIEHAIYRYLIDWYYLDESPIPKETQTVSRRLRLGSDSELKALQSVLTDFFVLGSDGWHHPRIDMDIASYNHKQKTNQENGKRGGRPKKTQSVILGYDSETETKPNTKATINHKPLTSNQEPVTNNKTKPSADALDGFDEFWMIYDKKVEKPQAEKAWKRTKPSIELQMTIYAAARQYVQSTPDKKFRKNPSTWLNNQCWNDEVVVEQKQPQKLGFFAQLGMIGGQNDQQPTPIAIGVDQ